MHDMSNEGKACAHPLLRCFKKPQEHSAEKAAGRKQSFRVPSASAGTFSSS